MATSSLTGFVNGLYQSALLDSEQRAEVKRLQSQVGDVRELAQNLLRREWLTAYQINQIFQGKAADLTIGTYVVMERLGEGGMGQVYKARQKLLNRVVALKVIRRECLDNPKAIRRFQREIRAASQLSHPHIVRAFDADQVDGTYYFAMELIEGTDLAKLVKESGPLRVEQACEYIRQAALGLQHALERGLVHRDIKPANLLVTRAVKSDRHRSSGVHRRPNLDAKKSSGSLPRIDIVDYPFGVVKILDMGLARCSDPVTGRSASHLTQIGSVMGTPDYIAPEQARDSHSSDIRADLYSLGCTLYFLLTGQAPFPKGSLTDKLLHHQHDEPTPLALVRHERFGGDPARADMVHVPAAVVDLVARLMAKQPADRPQTPQELADILQSLLQQMADGTLAAAEVVAKMDTAEMEAIQAPPSGVELVPASAQAVSAPIIPVREARRSRGTFHRRSLWLALCGGVCFVLLSTALAAVIGANSHSQARAISPATSTLKK